MSGRARGRIIYKLADLIERDLDMLATVESLDNGKPLSVAKAADITLTIDHLRYFAGWADKLEGKTIPTDGNHFAYTLVEPKGVVGQIVPWNFPALMMAWKIAPALACGNAIVLKPAEQTPMSALIIGAWPSWMVWGVAAVSFRGVVRPSGPPCLHIHPHGEPFPRLNIQGCAHILSPSTLPILSAMFHFLRPHPPPHSNSTSTGKLALEAGLPPGVLNILPGFGPTAGARLTSHPAVDKVAFTGSTEVGRIIMKSCAEHIKDVTLELGGKSAMIIGPTKDIDNAVDIAHFALFFNQGQVCTAASRLFVHESVYDEFCAKAAEYARKRKVGDPFEAETEQGPQIDNEQFEKILGYIESGKEQGARLLTGGARVGKKGFYIQPTVFADVKDEMKIAREEIFGPVQSILKWSTTEEVLRRANASEYGLAAGIVCDDIHLVNTLSRGLRAGTIWVNTYHVYDHGVPFGGYKMSGVGRDKGSAALAHYTNTKAVVHKLEGEQAWL